MSEAGVGPAGKERSGQRAGKVGFHAEAAEKPL